MIRTKHNMCVCITLIRHELWPTIFGPDIRVHDSALSIMFIQKQNSNRKEANMAKKRKKEITTIQGARVNDARFFATYARMLYTMQPTLIN